jgi:hypothetical protein
MSGREFLLKYQERKSTLPRSRAVFFEGERSRIVFFVTFLQSERSDDAWPAQYVGRRPTTRSSCNAMYPVRKASHPTKKWGADAARAFLRGLHGRNPCYNLGCKKGALLHVESTRQDYTWRGSGRTK